MEGAAGAAVAGGLFAITVFVLLLGETKARRVTAELEQKRHSVARVLDAVVPRVEELGWKPVDIRAGDLFILPQPAAGDPARPPGDGLTGGYVDIDDTKCILLDLSKVMPAGAGAAAAGGGGAPTADSSSLSGAAAMSTTHSSEVGGGAPLPQDGSLLTPVLAGGSGRSGPATMGPDTVAFRSRSGGRQLHSLVFSAPETVSDFVRRALGFGGFDLGNDKRHEHNE